jgi:hypothetical protein
MRPSTSHTFHGTFVAVTYYTLNYSDPVGTAVVMSLDSTRKCDSGVRREGRWMAPSSSRPDRDLRRPEHGSDWVR